MSRSPVLDGFCPRCDWRSIRAQPRRRPGRGSVEGERIEIEFAGETRLATAALRDSYRALGCAHRGLGQADAAITHFQRVLMQDSTHAGAQWALQELEFELGRRLTNSGRL